ncbi:hypothetical protein M569_15215, partial [Genlisea aurea]
PPITLPPRSAIESLFSGGTGESPGPMTLVSSFFAENDPENDCRSFSQLLAGPTDSPLQEPPRPPPGVFPIPSGMSFANLLDSNPFDSRQLFFSSFSTWKQTAFGPLHHQGFQSREAQSTLPMKQQIPAAPPPLQDQQLLNNNESYDISFADQKSRYLIIDKPTDDGYNWRKYGQKQVKGGEFPRSYYKCTHPQCPVKKKVERSLEGQITEIIYRGQHNHSQPSKRTGNTNEAQGSNSAGFGGSESQGGGKLVEEVSSYLSSAIRREQDHSQLKPEQVSGSSDSEGLDDADTGANGAAPETKRRYISLLVPNVSSSHRTVTEARIIVQTTSEVDLLDDGYRWRKYGQKVVKGNPYPRSYYKCTHPGCNIRKHVERAASDPKAVITTYEGKHNHDVPPSKGSSSSSSS